MSATQTLAVGERYLFKEIRVTGDVVFEATIEEVSPSGAWTKLGHYPAGTCEWKLTSYLYIEERLPASGDLDPSIHGLIRRVQANRVPRHHFLAWVAHKWDTIAANKEVKD